MPSGHKNEDRNRVTWTQSRLDRLTQGGSKGAQASIIGFVLVGPVVGGFLIGWWLDEQLGTSYWTIIIGLLGVFSGFREMFLILKRIAPGPGERTPPPGRSLENSRPRPPSTPINSATGSDEGTRQRLFTVPPPPFLESAAHTEKSPSQEDVLKELLGEDESPDGADSKPRNA
jgi:hypothetical protein